MAEGKLDAVVVKVFSLHDVLYRREELIPSESFDGKGELTPGYIILRKAESEQYEEFDAYNHRVFDTEADAYQDIESYPEDYTYEYPY